MSLSCLAALPRFPRLCRPPLPQGGAFTGPGPKGSAIWPAWVSPPMALDPCSQDTGNCHRGLDDLACDHRGLRTTWPQVLLFLAAHYLQPLLCSLTGYHRCSSLLVKQEPRVILTCSRCPSSKRCWRYCCRRVSGFLSLACVRTSSSVVFHLLVFSSSHPTSSECPEGSRHTAGLFSPAWLLGWHLPIPGDTVPALAVLASSRPGVRVQGPALGFVLSIFTPASGLHAQPLGCSLLCLCSSCPTPEPPPPPVLEDSVLQEVVLLTACSPCSCVLVLLVVTASHSAFPGGGH